MLGLGTHELVQIHDIDGRNIEVPNKWQLNFNLVFKYYENDFIGVLLFECQKYYVMAVLHREMIPKDSCYH